MPNIAVCFFCKLTILNKMRKRELTWSIKCDYNVNVSTEYRIRNEKTNGGDGVKISTSLSIQYDNIFSPFPGRDWAEGLQWVRGSGFDAVEIILSDPALIDRRALERQLERLNLPVSTISTGQAMGLEGLSLCSASRAVRDGTLARLREDIDLSVSLGRPHVTVGLIRGRGGELDVQTERELLADSLKRIVEYAQRQGVMLNLEPINRYECRHLNASVSALELIRQIGSPSCMGVLYDTFHSNIEDADMCQSIHQLKGWISNVHLADSNRRLPGEGHIDFAAIRRQLEEDGYTGYAALEVLNTPSADHIRQHAGEAARTFLNMQDEKGEGA